MFAFLDSFANLLLTALLLLWALLLFGGFLLRRYDPQTNRRMPTWTRMVSSLALVAAGWGWWLLRGNVQLTAVDLLFLFIAVGMTLGFLGDLFMARLIVKGDLYVLAGIASFGLGHIAYIVALLSAGGNIALSSLLPPLGFWWLFALVAWYWVVLRPAEQPSVLHYAALPYALLLATTTGIASGYALQNAVFLLLALGAVLFLLSDLLLAAELFSGAKFRMIGDVIWLLYGPGQMLIVYGIGLAALLEL